MTFRSRSASVIWSEGSTADSGSGYNPSTSLAASQVACSASFPPCFQASQASSRRTGQLVLTLKKQWLNLVLPWEKAVFSPLQRRSLYPFSRLVVYLLGSSEIPHVTSSDSSSAESHTKLKWPGTNPCGSQIPEVRLHTRNHLSLAA